MPILAALLPLGALVTGLVLAAVPVLILMAVWATVHSLRVLFPERPLPFEPTSRRHMALRSGAVPARLRGGIEDPAQRPSPSVSGVEPGEPDVGAPAAHPLFADLWLRRN